MTNTNVTRGNGILETFLSKQRSLMANKLISEKQREGRILDIGSGSYPLNLINTTFNDKYAIDKFLNEDHKKIDECKDINFFNFDLEKETILPFNDNYFDVVTMLAVFEHIEKDKLIPMIVEIKRVLKDDGIYILTVPAYWTDKLLVILAKIGLVSKEEVEEHKDSYTHKKIFYYLNKSGFSNKNIKAGYFELFMNLWVVAKK
ncbi:MAG: class I SAM-dependent methyltransferase [Candidatus Sericytochromatia bacterium]